MVRETVHIISHSHWDREWYLPFESYRMRLVELIDTLLLLFDTDPDFKSFHLDGQTIILDDYLAIRPQNKARLEKAIAEGKLIVGPFYILQDDYLITDEAHVRNALIGYLDSQKWGVHTKIGYYPDTFGNAGQIPQLLKQAQIDVALFGRGVKPVGFDNQVLPDHNFQSQYSEMLWEGADGSTVLGILFANWYSNGNEIPVEKEAARAFWDRKLADVRKYASTSHYLLMNGCDHQPVQKNLSKAIALARELYPEIDFIHSNVTDYIAAVKKELPTDLGSVKGELTSQETDGWYTLANTASSRVYLKQENDEVSDLLTSIVEPLAVMTGDTYPKDELNYAWRLLLQNAPHDSICGCSVDEVHREMQIRFAKVRQVGNFLKERHLTYLGQNIDTKSLEGYLVTVVNTSPYQQTQWVEAEVILSSEDYRDGHLAEHYKHLSELPLEHLVLYDSKNQLIEAEIEDVGTHFYYTLPKDAFRTSQFARKVRLRFVVDHLPAWSWETYQLKKVENDTKATTCQTWFENDFIRLDISRKDGLSIYDKQTQRRIPNSIQFEDMGDLGNEYVFLAPKNSQPIYASLEDWQVTRSSQAMTEIVLTYHMTIPIAMEDRLLEEQEQLIEFRHRQSERSQKVQDLVIETRLRLYQNSPQLQVSCRFKNQMKDHRIRMIVATGLSSLVHEADSIFEVITRPNSPEMMWENPSFPNRHRSFISLAEGDKQVTLATKGLHEYEILDNEKIALTLLRSVGELGDWGYFPTPDAQCLGDYQFDLAIEWHKVTDKYAAFKRARALQTPLLTRQVEHHAGRLAPKLQALYHEVLEDEKLAVTSLKVSEDGQNCLLRYWNTSQEDYCFVTERERYGVDLLEQKIGILDEVIKPQEIQTEIIK